MAVSELFGLEIPVLYLYLILGALCALFTEDTLPLLPVLCCIYMCFSARTSIGDFAHTVLSSPANAVHVGAIVACAAVLLAGKTVITLVGAKKRRVPLLLFGFLALGAAYLLSGLFSPYYGSRTVLFGFAEIVCLAVPYLFFYYTADWEKADKSYIFTVFLCIGVGLLAETVGMYFRSGVVQDGGIVRDKLFVGWGVYNFIGCVMAMCVPAPFYFAAKRKHGWLFAVLGCLFFLGVILTQSRGSILFGSVVFAASAVFALVKAEKRNKIGIAAVLGAFVLLAIVTLLILHEPVAALFKTLIASGSSDAGRFKIYRTAWDVFTRHPVFGEGWYRVPGSAMDGGGSAHFVEEAAAGVFIPPRAHNTLFQLLAAGGIFAALSYLFHRFQTLWLLFRHPSYEKTMIFASILALLLTSLLDCNLFNLGPGILYGCLLAAAEGSDPDRLKPKERKKK